MIEITGLHKSFGNTKILNSVSLSVDKGDIFGLVGRSGEGKSTLLRCINGLIPFDSGDIVVAGTGIDGLHAKDMQLFRKKIGMVFQQFALLERKTIFENIALPLRAWKYEESAIKERVNILLDMVGIADKALSKPRELSGGQKQRVGIARALALEPELLLCDEATSALDPKTTKDILNLLKTINQKLGITIVMVTHEMHVVKDICKQVAILENGTVTAVDSAENIFLYNSHRLEKLIGDGDLYLPGEGYNFKIILPSGLAQGAVISKMIRTLDIDVRLIGGSMEKYNNALAGSFLVNADTAHKSVIQSYLKDRHIPFEDMPNGFDN